MNVFQRIFRSSPMGSRPKAPAMSDKQELQGLREAVAMMGLDSAKLAAFATDGIAPLSKAILLRSVGVEQGLRNNLTKPTEGAVASFMNEWEQLRINPPCQTCGHLT